MHLNIVIIGCNFRLNEVFKTMLTLKDEDSDATRISDRDLMLSFKEGDNSSFRLIYNRYIKRIFSMAYRFTGNYEMSKDISQEVFLRLVEKKKLYKPEIHFNTFFYRLAYNCVLNYIRDHRDRIVIDNKGGRPLYSEPAAEEKYMAVELARQMESRLSSLPENQKMAFILNKIEGLRYSEVAEVMDLSIESVKTLVFRATHKVIEGRDG